MRKTKRSSELDAAQRETEAAHEANLELRQALDRTKELSESRLRDLTKAQGEIARLKQDERTRTQLNRSVRRVVRTIVIEGDQLWVAQTLLRALPDGQTSFGVPSNRITMRTDTDQTTWVHPLDGRDGRTDEAARG